MDYKFANRMDYITASEIREILKVTENPEIISFAGGLPAPELFPVEEIIEVSRIVLEEEGAQVLQYTTTEGYLPLRRWIAGRMNFRLNTNLLPDNIILTHGSQQGLDLSGKLFLDEGDIVLCESPTYLAAITAFRAYGCSFIEVPTDDDGMIPDELEKILKTNDRVKLIYVIPDFQNPTGRTWSLARRKTLIQTAMEYNVTIIEDNPYGELRFEGEALPAIKSFDESGCVILLGTFSKIFCPGYRIGWVAGDRRVIEKYGLVKQCTDLQCNTLAQREIAKFLEMYDIEEHIAKIREVYKTRRDLMVKTMEETFPAVITFTRPQGGLFAWVELPAHINARDVLVKSLARNIAFVPGGPFFPNGNRENTFRVNFSNMPENRIVEGLHGLAEVLREFVE